MAQDELDVALLTPADAGELLTLRRAAFARAAVAQALAGHRPDGLLPELADVVAELADETRLVLGGRRAGRLVASIGIEIRPPVATLAVFAVAPDVQHQGLGTRLLEAVPERLPDTVSEVSIAPLPGTEDAGVGVSGYRAADLTAFAVTSAYLRRIGAD